MQAACNAQYMNRHPDNTHYLLDTQLGTKLCAYQCRSNPALPNHPPIHPSTHPPRLVRTMQFSIPAQGARMQLQWDPPLNLSQPITQVLSAASRLKATELNTGCPPLTLIWNLPQPASSHNLSAPYLNKYGSSILSLHSPVHALRTRS
ncbi:uncharacterized protein BO97DRAFT_31471 [Aspergillus homomorphus CBS 101889]|uniref:Uncharacterized protein n=1 Tax=Aspergillus homomorphus (strain CBS 101889) TaxID=1450537 RepID=A0A395I041_ASPHC|nr:hypothetical protein BO97DRAFT_31471 [Aspergillus homomorphus CBS 101889]RAL13562.1 hypothetical protein BO97DRAFT_31471 [Aspergillus homomorphus CBS 101889]